MIGFNAVSAVAKVERTKAERVPDIHVDKFGTWTVITFAARAG
jgi:hypothetical protein